MRPLTGGSLSVVPGIYVPFALAPFGPRHFLHAVDFGDTQLGVEGEVHLACFDGQVAVVPVPQLLQVLVVEDIEGVVPTSTETGVSTLSPLHPLPTRLPVTLPGPPCGGSKLHGLCQG